MSKKMLLLPCTIACAMCAQGLPASGLELDLARAVIVASAAKPIHAKAAEMLQVEVFQRSGVRLEQSGALPSGDSPVLIVGTVQDIPGGGPVPERNVPAQAEAYGIWIDIGGSAAKVYLVGYDDRGTLFAAGRLLRLLHMEPGRLSLDAATRVATAPRYRIRGHQLGYRNLSNSYDAWDLARYEQYIRDLAVFGANTIELIPTLEPQLKDGPHMRETVWEMTTQLSKLIASYGLAVSLWLPLEEDVSKPDAAEQALAQRKALFENCAQIDAVFVPGGDPGNTPPNLLLPWLSRMAVILRIQHPNAEVWLSNQGFEPEENDFFFNLLRQEPDWLTGVVYGPWTKLSLEEERARVPQKYPIRWYPDICHSVRCQYPVPHWDRAFAHALGREAINPRPLEMAHIVTLLAPQTVGFVTYSDGVNDDVNKIVWSALGWDPGMDVREILREYGRYFVGQAHTDPVAEGLSALEQNWQGLQDCANAQSLSPGRKSASFADFREGPILQNENIEKTLTHWQAIEQELGERVAGNWRLQMALLRAYNDAYVSRKLRVDMETEDRVRAKLAQAEKVGVPMAVLEARSVFKEADARVVEPELRQRMEALGEALFKSIGMQLSVAKYGAKNPERGCVLDYLDVPLNDRGWLLDSLAQVLAEGDDSFRLKRLREILDWENPGPAGFYDDLGNAGRQPHLVFQKSYEEDPGFVHAPQDEFSNIKDNSTGAVSHARLSWLDQAQTLYDTSLRMQYIGLDPAAAYRVRITYTGRFKATVRLTADGKYEIHGPLPQPVPIRPVEFDIPPEATRDGQLEFEWQRVEGRGIQVAEIWLLRKQI